MHYIAAVCIILVCIVLLVSGVSIKLALFVAAIAVIAYARNRSLAARSKKQKQKQKQKQDHTHAPYTEFRADGQLAVFGGNHETEALLKNYKKGKYARYYAVNTPFKTIIKNFLNQSVDECRKQLNSTYIIHPAEFIQLATQCLNCLKRVRIVQLRNYYNTIADVDAFINRLISNRSLVFITSGGGLPDKHITKVLPQKFKKGGALDATGNQTGAFREVVWPCTFDRPLNGTPVWSERETPNNYITVVNYTLSYNEMAIASLCGISA